MKGKVVVIGHFFYDKTIVLWKSSKYSTIGRVNIFNNKYTYVCVKYKLSSEKLECAMYNKSARK